MSEENVEIVRAWFARLGAGDPAPDMCDPGVQIRNWAESPVPGPYDGHDGLLEWWRDIHDPEMGLEMEFFALEEVHEIDEERVVTIQRATGRGRASGIEVEQQWGSIISVRNGKISSAHGFASREHALEAAGLSE
jgi:ketosteroid isomerase-like protein